MISNLLKALIQEHTLYIHVISMIILMHHIVRGFITLLYDGKDVNLRMRVAHSVHEHRSSMNNHDFFYCLYRVLISEGGLGVITGSSEECSISD